MNGTKQSALHIWKESRKCRKLNHFASVCKTKRQTVKKVDTSSDSSDYEEIKMVRVDDKRKPEKSSSTKQFPKRLYASITVGKQSVNFQLDSGATCNVISSMLEQCLGKVQFERNHTEFSRCITKRRYNRSDNVCYN